PPPSAPAGASDGGAGPPTWRVEAGDHLWSIAEAVLAEARSGEVADAEVAAYWRALIEANRDALPDPANPDLIRPGLVLELPDP
ncbi:MAG: LysM peptidoglycan-binding domain-containing protein, partial [Actinomycetota bacterium]